MVKDPQRGKDIDRSNVVFYDIIDQLSVSGKGILRFKETAESRFGMLANRDLDKLIEVIQMLQGRIKDERKKIEGK